MKLVSLIAILFSFSISSTALAEKVTEYVKCESKDHKTRSCGIKTKGDIESIEVSERLSSERCRNDYKVYGNRIIVEDGCRAIFKVKVNLREYIEVEDDSDLVIVRLTCSSIDKEENKCYLGEGIQDVYILEQLSSSSCDQGDDWDTDYSKIWVDNGCRAKFEVLKYKF